MKNTSQALRLLVSAMPFPILPRLALLALLLLSLSAAQAYPPDPYYIIYGIVRDRYGTPLTSSTSQVILQTPAGSSVTTTILPGYSAGVNYQMKVPLDTGQTPDLWTPNALLATATFKMVVVVGAVTNLPIEMTGSYANIGQPGSSSRIDLTLGVDSNGDGLPDAWEYAFLSSLGLNLPLSSINANSVLTPDGLTLRQQYVLGTGLFDPGDPLIIKFVGFYGAAPILQFPTVSGRSYTILSSPDLKHWSPIRFNLAGDAPGAAPRSFYLASTIAPVQVYVAPPPLGTQAQFYRIQVQ